LEVTVFNSAKLPPPIRRTSSMNAWSKPKGLR